MRTILSKHSTDGQINGQSLKEDFGIWKDNYANEDFFYQAKLKILYSTIQHMGSIDESKYLKHNMNVLWSNKTNIALNVWKYNFDHRYLLKNRLIWTLEDGESINFVMITWSKTTPSW